MTYKELTRYNIKLSERTEGHFEILRDDILEAIEDRKLTTKLLTQIMRESFIEGIIHSAALHLETEKFLATEKPKA
jgi:hypothetical protein